MNLTQQVTTSALPLLNSTHLSSEWSCPSSVHYGHHTYSVEFRSFVWTDKCTCVMSWMFWFHYIKSTVCCSVNPASMATARKRLRRLQIGQSMNPHWDIETSSTTSTTGWQRPPAKRSRSHQNDAMAEASIGLIKTIALPHFNSLTLDWVLEICIDACFIYILYILYILYLYWMESCMGLQ